MSRLIFEMVVAGLIMWSTLQIIEPLYKNAQHTLQQIEQLQR